MFPPAPLHHRLSNSICVQFTLTNSILRTIYLNELRLIGSTGFSHGEFKKIVSYIETKKIKPVVAKTYPLDNIHQAQKDFIDKKFFGKLVLVP